MTRPSVVAFGGGHGLSASLAALRHVVEDVTAVVTVADDGGSSGRLRDEFGMLPPGDLRMALAALCDDSEWGHTWADVLQHRFTGEGALAGHALGNLLIVALWQLHADPVTGLDLVGSLLRARGRVLPMAGEPLEMVAQVRGADPKRPDALSAVRGQVAVAQTGGTVESVGVQPVAPAAPRPTVDAVINADWLILGPGSWYTSVIPHLLVPDLRQAILTSHARRLLTLNLELETSETAGFTAAQHVDSLHRIAPELTLDVVLADPSVISDSASAGALHDAAAAIGAQVVVSAVGSSKRCGTHDTLRLAAAYRDILL